MAILTARDLMAAGMSRSAAYRVLAANAPALATAPRELGSGARRQVLALVVPDAPTMGAA